MPDVDDLMAGFVTGKSREQITAEKSARELQRIANSLEAQVAAAKAESEAAKVAAEKADRRAFVSLVIAAVSAIASTILGILQLVTKL